MNFVEKMNGLELIISGTVTDSRYEEELGHTFIIYTITTNGMTVIIPAIKYDLNFNLILQILSFIDILEIQYLT